MLWRIIKGLEVAEEVEEDEEEEEKKEKEEEIWNLTGGGSPAPVIIGASFRTYQKDTHFVVS